MIYRKGDVVTGRSLQNKVCVRAYPAYLRNDPAVVKYALAYSDLFQRTVAVYNTVLDVEDAYPVSESLQSFRKYVIHRVHIGSVEVVVQIKYYPDIALTDSLYRSFESLYVPADVSERAFHSHIYAAVLRVFTQAGKSAYHTLQRFFGAVLRIVSPLVTVV